jgi:hypothetical protein
MRDGYPPFIQSQLPKQEVHNFGLPTVDMLVRSVDETSWLGDINIGEMLLNFMLTTLCRSRLASVLGQEGFTTYYVGALGSLSHGTQAFPLQVYQSSSASLGMHER